MKRIRADYFLQLLFEYLSWVHLAPQLLVQVVKFSLAIEEFFRINNHVVHLRHRRTP